MCSLALKRRGSSGLGDPVRSEQVCSERTESVLLNTCVLKEKKS